MEKQIAFLLAQKNPESITLLYANYAGSLYSIILRIVISRTVAEDCLQETFIKIWKNSNAYDASKGRIFTWILNIARNTAIDATRNIHYKNARLQQTLDDLEVIKSFTSFNEDTVGFRNLLVNMDDKYRILIEKIYFEGYNQNEASEELGIPVGTVKTRLRSAMKELRCLFSTPNVESRLSAEA